MGKDDNAFPHGLRTLTASDLAQYVTRNRCERYLRLFLYPAEREALRDRYHARLEGLSPVMSESGNLFERDRIAQLRQTEQVNDLQGRAAAFAEAVKAQPPGRVFYNQLELKGHIGPFASEGRADLVRVERHTDGSLDVLVIDLKATRRETVGFRLQVAFYARLIADSLTGAGLQVRALQGAIAGRDDEFAADAFRTFDLALYLDEIERLIAAPDSDAARAARATLETAAYHLGHHCDGCLYSALCFIDAAEKRGLSLVPLLSASEKSALTSEGVRTADDLAGLYVYGERSAQPAPGREDGVKHIGARWPLGSRLPILAQRARAALRRQDSAVEARNYLPGSDYGSLPDGQQYPDLIKVFLDAQRDHIEDRLYLIACHIVGPGGTREVVEMTPDPPDDQTERDLMIAWIQRALPAVASVAASGSAPVHVYLFDRRGQRALLDAMARHFDALCAIPAFYDLLTSSPALTQSMISFLEDEVRSRLNLGAICQNLYRVARELGFRWQHDSIDFPHLFRARVFDSMQAFRRDPATGLFEKAQRDSDKPLWVEAAARFGTQIPLEYAHAAWGQLSDAAYQVEADHLRQFALHRCRALRHIEEHFKYKSRSVKKQPLDLSKLDQVEVDPADVPLRRSLEDFLYLEHHAAFQERLLHLALPPELRAETGRTAILRCDSQYKSGKDTSATFTVVDINGTPLRAAEAEALRMGEGDWVALNPLTDEEGATLTGKKLAHGRLATVEEIDTGRIRLRLMSMNFRDSEFRYRHNTKLDAQPGMLYTIDEMADDMNADKFLEACRNATSNHLYNWLDDPAEGKQPRPIRPKRLREVAEKASAIAALAAASQAPYELTEAQRGVVGGYIAERVLVLQGPPGTGKSHTLGFAVLSRMLAFATRPFRVAVAARTHAATMVALESIVKRAGELLRARPDDERLAPLADLRVAKIANTPGETGIAEIKQVSEAKEFRELLEAPLLVVGGTPGGIYNMIKKGASRRGKIDWAEKYFDLVVVDEASQMGIAEALTASAFLRQDGQFIAIGDHRQMPPILAHAWDQEGRRDLSRARPHLSIFEYLRDALGFPRAALDQSFRIPAEIADFLHRHVYADDGIEFHSQRRDRLGAAAGLAGWLAAALAPDHPLVIIEHDEAVSQRENRFEAALIEQLVRAAVDRLGLEAREGVGIVVPHRAQKFLLRSRLPELAEAIDTVERFQGGERDLMIVSATVSDREFAMLESGFLLEPRRLTVAISRPKKKLVVISSRSVFNLIPGDLDEYERGALWKYLRHECGPTLWEGEIDGQRVAVRALRLT